jgi:hypothetical protein
MRPPAAQSLCLCMHSLLLVKRRRVTCDVRHHRQLVVSGHSRPGSSTSTAVRSCGFTFCANSRASAPRAIAATTLEFPTCPCLGTKPFQQVVEKPSESTARLKRWLPQSESVTFRRGPTCRGQHCLHCRSRSPARIIRKEPANASLGIANSFLHNALVCNAELTLYEFCHDTIRQSPYSNPHDTGQDRRQQGFAPSW